MKKMMTAAVVMACAIASQAATMQWGYETTAAELGYNVYMILGDSAKTDWANASEVDGASFSSAQVQEVTGAMSKKYYQTGTIPASGDDLTKTTSLYFVLVKADGSQFAVTTPAVPNDSGNYVYGQQDSEGSAYELAGKFGSFQDFASVPEPTSAMLLLLGVAGLALRRKQA